MIAPDDRGIKGDILVVDDTPDNLRLLSAMLTRHHLGVRKALSGHWAIAAALAALPDLILLDIKMPEMSGYEVCQRLKANPVTEAVPVIFISALDDPLDKVRAFAVGGADYITKPFQEAEVVARIAHQLELRRLQSQLQAQNEELARSNRELEQFASVVSHDLQQPLQSIMGYTKLISLVYPDIHQSAAQPYLEHILVASDRMRQLIQDWLVYAQAGQGQPNFAPVAINSVIDQVMLNLKVALSGSGATVTYGDLPTVLGNEVQLLQLFQNLISNALKFIQPNTTPHITVSAQTDQQEWQFGVQDNGIGIAPEHLGHIFQAFHRLHDAKTYSGSGIGLTTCEKIVTHHGGRIWAESQLGAGSTIYFTLPCTAPGAIPSTPVTPFEQCR
jgi:two-component system, sensor histidine kinase and response regulator